MKKLMKSGLLNTSFRFRVTIAMVFMSLIPGLVLVFVYYGNMKNFYEEKIQTYQENSLNVMSSQIKDLVDQREVIEKQVLGMTVTSTEFDNYSSMNSYEKLKLSRNINSQLKNMKMANDAIDDIYMIGFDGSYFSSNSDGTKEKYFKENNFVLEEDQEGKTVTLPPHNAAYKFLNPSKTPHFVVSEISYLNQYTRAGVIGLIEIDIDYSKIEEAMNVLNMTETDFSFIVDDEENLIYEPDNRIAAAKIQGILAGTLSEENMIIQEKRIGDSSWRIIQVNSEAMLTEELAKLKNIWATIATICLASAILIALSLSHGITRSITKIIRSMHKVSDGNFDIKLEVPSDKDLAELIESFNIMVREVDKLMKENITKERERMTMELVALNSQINSHFLYNTLNTIKWMAIKKDADDIVKMVISLVNMLKYSCSNIDKPVLITEELSFIEDYVYIQKVRFKSNVKIYYEIDEEVKSCMILKMLLQPIVENAILHGFSDRNLGNEINVQIKKTEHRITILIRDNGKGFEYNGNDKLTGIGLNNIQDRISLNYGEDYGIHITSSIGEGTDVIVEIPVISPDISGDRKSR